jgi:hypothetical protein
MALAVDLPSDRGIRRTNLIVTCCTSSGPSVPCDVLAVLAIDNHATHQVGVKVRVVIDDSEDLRLDADGFGSIDSCKIIERIHTAKYAIVERRLVLVRGVACTYGGMWPMDFVSFPDVHVIAVHPLVWFGKFGVRGSVLVAPEADTGDVMFVGTGIAGQTTRAVLAMGVYIRMRWGRPMLIVLSLGIVLGADMPMHVDWAQLRMEVIRHNRPAGRRLKPTLVAKSDVGPGLLDGVMNLVQKTWLVVKPGASCGFFPVARVRGDRLVRIHWDKLGIGLHIRVSAASMSLERSLHFPARAGNWCLSR